MVVFSRMVFENELLHFLSRVIGAVIPILRHFLYSLHNFSGPMNLFHVKFARVHKVVVI